MRTSLLSYCMRRGDPLQPVGVRFGLFERQDEADACSLVHAGMQDLAEPLDGSSERGGVEWVPLLSSAVPCFYGRTRM